MKPEPTRVRIDLPTWLKVLLILAAVVAVMLVVGSVLDNASDARDLYR